MASGHIRVVWAERDRADADRVFEVSSRGDVIAKVGEDVPEVVMHHGSVRVIRSMYRLRYVDGLFVVKPR